MTISAYTMGDSSMMRDRDCSRLQVITGFNVYSLWFGTVPLVSASFSEEFGRRPLYIISGIGFILMFTMMALWDSSFESPFGPTWIDTKFLCSEGEKYPNGDCSTLSAGLLRIHYSNNGWRNNCWYLADPWVSMCVILGLTIQHGSMEDEADPWRYFHNSQSLEQDWGHLSPAGSRCVSDGGGFNGSCWCTLGSSLPITMLKSS